MELDLDRCYRAMKSRDKRFDGRFFVGVFTTGIYCRPVCPAPSPLRKNVKFFSCAAAAAEAGLRPCLRCRPEAAPGTPAWAGTSATVSRALRLIDEGGLDGSSVDELAAHMGIGERHLRRLFDEHVGASPLAVAQTRRIHFAKKLLDETDLSMTDVAFSAGFSSIRRFNTAIRNTYDMPPSALRKARRRARPARAADLELRLAYRPPLDVPGLLDYLRTRAVPGVEHVDETGYSRSFEFAGDSGRCEGVLRVEAAAKGDALCLHVPGEASRQLIDIVARVRRIFDLDAEPACIASHLARDRRLASMLRRHPGLRVPGAWDGFELAVRAILGQQVSVPRATIMAGEIVAAYGKPLASPNGMVGRLFPSPVVLAEADVASLGLMPAARAEAIRGLARAVRDGDVVLNGPAGAANTAESLTALPGIGPWTADYIAMRALREPDAFPSGDLALRKALGEDGKPVSNHDCADRSETWRPWRAYAAVALWRSESDRAAAAK